MPNDGRDEITKFNEIKKCFPLFYFLNNGAESTMFCTDKMGREVPVFIHCSEVVSPVGFLKYATAETNGIEVPKQTHNIKPRNNLVNKWSMVNVNNVSMYERRMTTQRKL